MCVRDQALLYYRLLYCGIEDIQRVLQGRRSDPSLGVLIGRPMEPINNWVHSFNTLEPLSLVVDLPNGGSPEHVPFNPKPHTELTDDLNACQVDNVHTGKTFFILFIILF